jgi:hypothetical protein
VPRRPSSEFDCPVVTDKEQHTLELLRPGQRHSFKSQRSPFPDGRDSVVDQMAPVKRVSACKCSREEGGKRDGNLEIQVVLAALEVWKRLAWFAPSTGAWRARTLRYQSVHPDH